MENNSFELEKTIESLMYKRGQELELAIENIRKENLSRHVLLLKEKISKEGRCPICTLRTPCKHFRNSGDIRYSSESSFTPKISVTPTSQKSTIFCMNPDMGHRKVRFRGKKTVSPKSSDKSDEFEKLKLMEKLENYKEEKLEKEIRNIEEIKKIQEIEYQKTKESEKK